MTTTDIDPYLISLCRQLESPRDQINLGQESEGNCSISLGFLSLSIYTSFELKYLSSSLGKCRLFHLEIEGVDDLDWDPILNNNHCVLKELVVTVKSVTALEHLVNALCHNKTLTNLELDYYHLDDTIIEERENNHYNDYCEDIGEIPNNEHLNEHLNENHASSTALDERFLKALLPLQHVVLRGITPSRALDIAVFDEKNRAISCSWEYLTLENCDLTGDNTTWLTQCIANLKKIEIENCQLSESTMKFLSEAYLTISTPRFATSRESHGRHRGRELRRKNALEVLDLSNNDWLLPTCDVGLEVDNDCQISTPEYFDAYGVQPERRKALPSPSCMTLLASWLDSLSNLIELDLSDNPQLFDRGMSGNCNRSMIDLCGTVNQSLKRLSLRNCCLIPNDLNHLVNTFCWLEGLDLSENPELSSDLQPLSQLEYLTELVLENMFVNDSNDSFEFERLLCDEDFGICTLEQGLIDLLHDLLSGESSNCDNLGGNPKRSDFGQLRRKPLERLNLSGNILSKKTMNILSMFKSLKILILMGCQINGEGILELLSATHKDSSLRELYIGSNTISDTGVLALAKSLKRQRLPRLKVLDMESNVISVEAFRVFVEDGLIHNKRLEFVEVSSDGAISHNQQKTWNELEEIMNHNLLLNQAGRFTLYIDSNDNGNKNTDCEIEILHEFNGNGRDVTNPEKNCVPKMMTVPTNLWPFILEDADAIYGPDALFYFLHKRPDLIFSSKLPPQTLSKIDTMQSADDSLTTPIKSAPQTSSPKGVADVAAYL